MTQGTGALLQTRLALWLTLWLAVALMAAGCVVGGLGPATEPTEARPGEIPFELAGPGGVAVVVELTLNGQGPYRFVVDTGATLTVVDTNLADQLQLESTPGTVGFGTGVGGEGATRLVQIDSLEVGNAGATDLTAAVIDLSNFEATGLEIDGLLGLNFLRSYRATFDFERNMLLLEQPGTAG